MATMDISKYVTTKQAAAMLGCNTSRVRQLLGSGALAGDKWGDTWMVTRSSVKKYAAKEITTGRPRSNKAEA